MRFKHNNIDIDLQDNGTFTAKVNGAEISAPSLPAIKKKIDKSAPFKPFDAITIDYYDKIEDIRIVGMVKQRNHRSWLWKTTSGRTHSSVYLDTPQVRAGIKKYLAAKKQGEKIREAQEALEDKLKAAIGTEISPTEEIL